MLTIRSPHGSGSTNPAAGVYLFSPGTSVQVMAAPTSGWRFNHWLLDGVDSGSANPTTVAMNSAHTLEAVFAQNQYTLTISVIGSGSTNPAAGSSSYASGSSVQVTAIPSSGWHFSRWRLDGVDLGSMNPATVTMNSAHTLEAVFTQIPTSSNNGLYFGSHTKTEVLSNPEQFADSIIYRSGDTYYAKSVTTGQITSSGTNARAVIHSTFKNSGIIYFRSGTYLISDNYGISLNGFSDITLIGATGTILKKAEPAGSTVGQVFEVGNSKNVYIYNIQFDQDRDNPNHEKAAQAGLQWIVREVGSDNVWFERCQFLNGEECGFITGPSTKLYLIECIINRVGEHPLYFLSTTELHVESCQILNWAKLLRGYSPKLAGCNQVSFVNCYWEPNEDGLGYPTSGPDNDYGVYGPVIIGSDNVDFISNVWQGDPVQPSAAAIVIEPELITNIKFEKCKFLHMGGIISTNPANQYEIKILECYFNQTSFIGQNDLPSKLSGCYFYEPSTFFSSSNGLEISNNTFYRNTRIQNYPLIVLRGNNILVSNNKFYNWTNSGIIADTSTDLKIVGNYFSGGVALSWINPGTRTRIVQNIWNDDSTYGVFALNTATGSNCWLTDNNFGTTLLVKIDLTKFYVIDNNIGYTP